MKNIKLLLIVCLIVMTYSCKNESNYTADYQIINKWIFLGFLNNDTKVEEFKPDNLNEMNIVFSDTNRFHAVSSCNSFTGYYVVSYPNSIIINSVIATLMYCVNDTVRYWEEKYFNELKNTLNYEISGNRLTIKTTSDINIIFRTD